MKHLYALSVVAGLSCTPVLAQDAPQSEMGEGLNLIEEGARMLLRGLIDEMEPSLDALSDSLADIGPAFGEFALSFGPAFQDVLEQIDDFSNYEAPEILPNGDIIMRRSPDAPVWQPEQNPSEIEL